MSFCKIINNDMKRILAMPDAKTSKSFNSLKMAADDVLRKVNDTKLIFPDAILNDLNYLKSTSNQIIMNKEVGPKSSAILKQTMTNIDDAIRELEVMLSQFG